MQTSYSNYLYSFDVGTNSIGWAVLGLNCKQEPENIVDMGVRIFSDGREAPRGDGARGASLAVERRGARAASRLRDRYLRRRAKTLKTFVEYGFLPDDKDKRQQILDATQDCSSKENKEKTDPYSLRQRALSEKLPLEYIFAFLNLQQLVFK